MLRGAVLILAFLAVHISGEKCKGGRRQSPIDIETKTLRYQEFRPFTLKDHHLLSIRKGNLVAKNTGETLKLAAKSDHTQAIIAGGPLNVDYEFVEMHFHWGDVKDRSSKGSEHRIDGQSYPLELHMVHRNIHDETVAEAVEHENGLTVLGFKFQVLEDTSLPTPAMDTLANITMKYLREPKSKFDSAEKSVRDIEGDVNVGNFLPVLMDEYFHYHGSLTTGGCQESVNWVVFKNPLAVHRRHLQALQEMKNLAGRNIANNFRETQPVFDRPVYYHGIDLIQRRVIKRGSSEGLRSKALPNHEDYVLTAPCPNSRVPQPAPMAESEERISAESLWERRDSTICLRSSASFLSSSLVVVFLAACPGLL